jgi:hypothetical protein
MSLLTYSGIKRLFHKEEQCPFLPLLPYEIVHKILSYLSPKDIWRARVIDRHFYAISLGFFNSAFASSVCTMAITRTLPERSYWFPLLHPVNERKNSHFFTWSVKIAKEDRRKFLNDHLIFGVGMVIEGQCAIAANTYHRSRPQFRMLRWPLEIFGAREFKLCDMAWDAPHHLLEGRIGLLKQPKEARLRVFRNGQFELSMCKESLAHLMEYCEQMDGIRFKIPL